CNNLSLQLSLPYLFYFFSLAVPASTRNGDWLAVATFLDTQRCLYKVSRNVDSVYLFERLPQISVQMYCLNPFFCLAWAEKEDHLSWLSCCVCCLCHEEPYNGGDCTSKNGWVSCIFWMTLNYSRVT
uniref:Uncharacterized protein n=1 Tax=Salvator merianae TaxID=96440 RepID=A0A8D0DWA8_SALMN